MTQSTGHTQHALLRSSPRYQVTCSSQAKLQLILGYTDAQGSALRTCLSDKVAPLVLTGLKQHTGPTPAVGQLTCVWLPSPDWEGGRGGENHRTGHHDRVRRMKVRGRTYLLTRNHSWWGTHVTLSLQFQTGGGVHMYIHQPTHFPFLFILKFEFHLH